MAEPIVTTRYRPKADPKTQSQRQPPYNVVILNDEEHTFDYVIDLLIKLFRHSLTTAQELTWRIHSTGRAVVYTTHKEKAEPPEQTETRWGWAGWVVEIFGWVVGTFGRVLPH